MSDSLLYAACALAIGAFWLMVVKARQWEIRAKVQRRINDHGADSNDNRPRFWLAQLATQATQASFTSQDYQDIHQAFIGMGKSSEYSQLAYLLLCWLLPLFVIVPGLLFLGPTGGVMLTAAAFVIPRRMIRSFGRHAEARQNLEAIELCHMTRMLMESGLSLERAMRIIGAQGHTLLPLLNRRILRFNRQMKAGADRHQALDELGDNKRIPVLRSYVILMKQSSQLGSGVSHSLSQIISEAQHVERSRRREDTNRIGAKMTVVMMIFMLPALFLLIGGPAVMSIADALSH